LVVVRAAVFLTARVYTTGVEDPAVTALGDTDLVTVTEGGKQPFVGSDTTPVSGAFVGVE
jgi:hypothetical protein